MSKLKNSLGVEIPVWSDSTNLGGVKNGGSKKPGAGQTVQTIQPPKPVPAKKNG